MTAYPLDIRLKEDCITIGSVSLVPRDKAISDLMRILGTLTVY